MRTIMIFSLVLFSGILSAYTIQANTSKIKGKVSADNVSVLQGAKVLIKSIDSSIQKEFITNAEGHFVISDLPIDHRYTCTVSHKDYLDITLKNFELEEGKSLMIDFKLYKEKNDEIGIETMALMVE